MHKGSIFFSKSNIIVKVVIWAVVGAFVLSIFIFAGTFNLNQKQTADIKEKELAELNKRQVNEEDRTKVLASIAGTTTSENAVVTVGDFFQILHNQDEQYQKFYSTKTQREGLLERIIEAKIVEQQTKGIVISPADYDEEINKIAATFPSRQVFDEQMKQRGMTRERLEEYFRTKIQEKKLKDQLSKPREVAETLLKEYYEKNKVEFTEMKKLPGATSETAMVKEFGEVKDAIRDKLLKEVSDAEIQKYYNEHLGQFKNPVSVKLAHIFIKSDSAAVKESVKPTEEELKKFYEFNKTKYKTTRSFEVKTVLKRFDNKEMRDAITVSDSEAVEFHAKNAVKFQKRAHADIKNILIDPKAQHRVDALKPTEQELRAFYDETAEVKASHILVDEETLAIELKKKIDGGAKLDVLAAENSKCPSKDKGGDLGYFKNNGSMVKEFEDAAFKLKLNEISAPVKTQFGWHIIKVTDQKKAYEKAFEDVSAEVKTAYTNKKLEDNAKKLAEEIAERIKKGENFADAAKKDSDAASKNNGGVLGIVYQDNKMPLENIDKLTGEIAVNGSVMPQILGAAFDQALKENVPSAPVRTALGYHVIMVSNRVEATPRPLAECKNEVIDEIKTEIMKTKIEQVMTDLRNKVKNGYAFETVSKEYSDAPGAKDGGQLATVYLGEAPKDYDKSKLVGSLIEKAADAVAPEVTDALNKVVYEKETSDIIKLPFGIAFVKVDKITEPTFKKYEDVKDAITEEFKKQKTEELIAKKLGEAAEKAKKGEDFAALAKQYSEGATKDNGGEAGEFMKGEASKNKELTEKLKGEIFMPWGAIDPVVEETIFELATGEVSAVVKSSLGSHVFKVLDKNDSSYKPFEDVKAKIKTILTRGSLVTAEEINKYYQEHSSEYTTKERVKARIITVDTQAEAEKIHGEITKNKKDFAAMASELSKDLATKTKGGDMGYIVRGQVTAELENAAFSLPVGSVSSVFKTNAGFNIIQVTEKEPAKTASLEEKKAEIREILITPKQNEILQEHITELKNTLKINRKKENFGFLTKYE